MLRCWGQRGNDEKRKIPEFRGHPVVYLLRKRNSVAAQHCMHRETPIHGSRPSLITEAACMVESPRLGSQVGKRRGDDRQSFNEMHS